jgi:uncharacterized protein
MSDAVGATFGMVATEKLLQHLIDELRPLKSVAVAFSGGVDSSVVVAAAARSLGSENVLAVTAKSETLPEQELLAATELASSLNIPHSIIETHELDNDEFCANSFDRCYHCKTELWLKLGALAKSRGISSLADGVNADDTRDYRPGIRASDEAAVVHPLELIGAGKLEVRSLARLLGLSNWDKPAQACLSSRFPYGSVISAEGLRRVEKAEEFLSGQGFGELRVRDHGDIARIEVPVKILGRLLADGSREKIVSSLKKLGYVYITMDLEGFRSGSMNETMKDLPQAE